MRLFHERPIPRQAALTQSDEEDCFTAGGRRTGVFLTSEPPARATDRTVTVDLDEAALAQFEVTQPGDDARSFVVPFAVIREWRDADGSRPGARR